ncbi:MAG TPA: hypothetical protein VGV39_28930 [Mesorhizobium sp.]|uniref:hypothetical protein n=1 Tax=Mesorhizobium sp. TaxID=1871066 RepID=UPI002DDCDDF9|nr:hypothetical protein [Mesorhizobium sp.]HEV2507131.1 hypothetical protein [Mesorhizobium sp.]
MAPSPVLKTLLLVCVVFFLCMGAAHFLGLKVPVLFIYFDTPFYAYQDRIISFTLVTYAALFFVASRDRAVVPFALISIWATVIGLTYINQSSELAEVLGGRPTTVYWLQTAALAALAAVLTGLFIKERGASAQRSLS